MPLYCFMAVERHSNIKALELDDTNAAAVLKADAASAGPGVTEELVSL